MTPEKNPPEMTVKAVGLGLFLALVFGAANAYLGMKAGQTVAATIPAAVIAIPVFEVPESGIPSAQRGSELLRNRRHLGAANNRDDYTSLHDHVLHGDEQRRSFDRIEFTLAGMK